MKSVTLFAAVFFASVWSSATAQVHLTEPAVEPARRPVRYVSRPLRREESGLHANAVAATATLPIWQAKDGTYSYQMVGTDPATTNVTTTIPAPIIPVVLTFSDGNTFDPSVKDSCSSQPPASLVLSSPVFSSSPFTVGGTSLGTSQYLDFFQRANFWQSVKTNSNYHVTLAGSVQPVLKLTVPAASGKTVAAGCGRLGEMDINWFDAQVSAAFSQLTATVNPATLPVFVLYNVVMYDTKATNCCILGYHSALNSSSFGGAVQTYAVAEFDTSNDFGSTKDVSALSHEVGEWLDDPTGTNPTPAWGHTGQVSSCQSNLEVGDPLSGTVIPITMSSGYTYHVQELAFKSWFYRDASSSGVNGWYSSNGSFTKPASACNTSATSLSINPTSLSPGSTATVSISVSASSGSGTPTGTVNLVSSAGNATLATYTLSNGSITGTLQPPSGSYTVTANYSGDTNFLASSSAAVSLTVGTPGVTLSPAALAFGSQNVATASAAQSVTLTNKGTASLHITSISITGASPSDFTESNNCSATMPVNTACTISVVFKPTAAGARTASVSIADNAAAAPQTVPLSGTGVSAPAAPKVTLSTNSLSFGAVADGSSASRSVVVTNTGTAALTGIAVSLAGANSAEFAETSACPASLAAGSSCSISVTFKPVTAGSKSASLSIADNAAPSPQTVALAGTGAAPAPQIASVTPASVKVNVATQLTIKGANFQKGFTASYTAERAAPAALTFVSAADVTLTVTPTQTGTGILTITNPDGQKATAFLQVTR